MPNDNEQKYIDMQKNWYESYAETSAYQNGKCIRDHIVGNFSEHEKFPYEEHLFKYYTPTKDHICFEYGCGPGRQIRRLLPLFRRVDGVDISDRNLKNAVQYIGPGYEGKLKVTNGIDVPLDDLYNFCYSIICLQHIPSYSIRRQILENMYSRLKNGGNICIQFAFGPSMTGTPTYGYKEDFYDARETNGKVDCRVDASAEVIEDFSSVGFKNLQIEFTETVVDHHPKWIWVYGIK